jgi:hypothetical protein
MNDSITSANSVFTISVPGLFPVPQQLRGYSAEKAWNSDNLDLAEVQMGVDGRLTAGYTPNPVKQTISLQADSPSKHIFNSIANATKAARNIYYISGTIDLPSTGESFICTRGVLQAVKPLPDAAKVLQPMEFMIVWESVNPTLI